MGFWARLFGRNKADEGEASEQAVIVSFQYGQTDLTPLHELEDQLEAAIEQQSVGEFDGNEVAVDGSEGTLYMYGPDADKLFSTVRPILEASKAIKEAVATLRYGPPEDGVKAVEVRIGQGR